MKAFKKIKDVFRIWKLISNNLTLFKIVEDIFKFVEKTHEAQHPMVTEIVLLNMANGAKISDFVSLWAGIGQCNPIQRASQLKAQNTELIRLLTLVKDGNVSKDEYEQIELVIKHFG